PASPLSTLATLQPRPDGDPFEAPMSSAQEYAESDTPVVRRLSLEHVEGRAVSPSAEPETAVELRDDSWSSLAIPVTPPEVSPATEPIPRASVGAFPAASQAWQDAYPHGSHETISLDVLYQTLGYHIVQRLRETLDAHLTTLPAQLMPHLLDTVR